MGLSDIKDCYACMNSTVIQHEEDLIRECLCSGKKVNIEGIEARFCSEYKPWWD